MQTSEAFRSFYEQELASLLTPLEEHRKKIKKGAVLGLVLLGISVLFFIIASSSKLSTPAIIAFILFLAAIITLVNYAMRLKKFTRTFKTEIVSRIMHFVDPSLRYSPEQYISETDYLKSGLFVEKPDRYKGDDYVEGLHGKTTFVFSELHTERRVSSGKNTHYQTIFKGLFFIADFNKHFSGRTYVWSERNPQINFLTKLFSSFAWNLEKVKLESKEFEDRFIVYSTDQVESRYILSPSFMERAVRLQRLMGDGVSLSFIDTNIYVAVPIREELFEPSVFSANDFSRLDDFRTTLVIVYDIMDELKLNDRLWTKE